MRIRKIVAGYIVLVFSVPAAAQGVIDFDEIPGINEEPVISVDLNAIVLGFIREMAREADPAAADILDGLRSIHLRVYHNGDNARRFSNFIDDVTEEIEDAGWLPVVKAQEGEGSKVRIHMQMTEQEVSGMTVMFTDGTEAVFINIDGTVSAQELGAVLAALEPYQSALGAINLGVPRGANPRPTVEEPVE